MAFTFLSNFYQLFFKLEPYNKIILGCFAPLVHGKDAFA